MRHWTNAASVTDLGNLMADWLEGRIPKRPGYYGRRPDPETTTRMIRTLAATNRAGYVTDNSQPGCDGIGFDGARWRQRAAVTGFIADRGLLATILDAARRHGLRVVLDSPAMVVTERAGQPYTQFGGTITGRDLHTMWDGIGRDAWGEIRTARQLAIIDPQWGPSDRLWDVLDQIDHMLDELQRRGEVS
jgi:hypothetical protein